jgi:hypothetical protein
VEAAMRRAKYPQYVLFLLISILLSGFVFAQEETTATIQEKHRSFYKANSEIDINTILNLGAYEIQKVLSVTLDYNMAFSSLDAQCLADKRVVQEISLPKGLGKSITCDYDVRFPGALALRLQGDRGQIQVTAVEASVIVGESDKEIAQTEFQSSSSPAEQHPQLGGVVALEKKELDWRQAKYFEILAPSMRDNWELGKAANLYWRSSGIGGQLALELFKDRNRVALLTRGISVNKGTFQWTVSGEDIVPGGGYQVRMTTLVDKKSYVSEAFSVLDDYEPSTIKKYTLALQTLELTQEDTAEPVSLTVLSPKYQDQWHVLQDHTIRWESEGLGPDDDIGIALKPVSKKMAKIIGIVKNTGEFTYHVPYPLIFTGFDIQVIITPLKDRSIEVLSDPFVIHKPMVDMIANSPTITYTLPQKPKKKWWQVLGDIFTGGVTWYVQEVVELSLLAAEGTTMQVDVNVMNKGYLTRKNVTVECSIQTLWGNVLYSFDRQHVPVVYPDVASAVSFSARTKGMDLEAGTYNLEILIDPDNRAGEQEAFRANNRVIAEFEVE